MQTLKQKDIEKILLEDMQADTLF